jgi:hypothetical protein
MELVSWTPWPESASELYRLKDRRLLAKLVPICAERRCPVVSVTDPYCRIHGFLDWSLYFFFQVVSKLYSRSWVEPVPDPLLLRKSGSARNRTRTSGSLATPITWLFLSAKMALTSPTRGGRSVGTVRSRTQAMEFSLVLIKHSWRRKGSGGG